MIGNRMRERAGNLAIAFLIGTGFYLVMMFMSSIMDPMMPTVPDEDSPGRWEFPMFTRDGSMHLIHPIQEGGFLNFDGLVIPMPNLYSGLETDHFIPKEIKGLAWAPRLELTDQKWITTPSSNYLKIFSNKGKTDEAWYLVNHTHPQHHGYFVGYDRESRRLIGYIGSQGFQDQKPDFQESLLLESIQAITSTFQMGSIIGYPESLPQDKTDPNSWMSTLEIGRKIWFGTPTGIRECDLGQRSIKDFAQIKDVKSLYLLPDFQKKSLAIVARTDTGFQFFDETGKRVAQNSYPIEKTAYLSLFLLDSGKTILTSTPTPHWVKETKRTVSISWFDASGKETKHLDQDLKEELGWKEKYCPRAAVSSLQRASQSIAGCFLIMVKYIRETSGINRQESGWYFLANGLLTLLAICCLWWRQLRYRAQVSESLTWTVFVALFGVVGLLGYLFHKTWPARVACPVCHNQRPIDTEECPVCGALFHSPSPDGTEILSVETIRQMALTA
ncbi:MAG: hypothetical protein WCH77_13455 [Planctomycetota bacterium]